MPEQPTPRTPNTRPTAASAQWRLQAMANTEEHPVVAEDATQPRPAIRGVARTTPTPDGPATILLPTLPPGATQPQLPAILSPHLVKPDNKTLQKHPTHPVTVVPALRRGDTAPHVVALPPRPGAKERTHRLALAGAIGAILVLMLAVVPMVHGAGISVPSWLAQSQLAMYPTITPTPVPVYPVHPVASGVGDFICVALPFARLAQQREIARGLPHPWYVSLTIAQWGFEQGWNIPGYTGYNWGNSSAIPGFPAVGGINVPGSPSAFAYAYTPVQGVEIYTTFTLMSFYTGVAAAYPYGAIAQAYALGQSPWDAGHYHEGGGPPGATLVTIINEFGLQRFDNPHAHC